MKRILTIVAALVFFAAAIPAVAMDAETSTACKNMQARLPELQQAHAALIADIAWAEGRLEALSIDEKIHVADQKADLLLVEEGLVATKAGLGLCDTIRALEREEAISG